MGVSEIKDETFAALDPPAAQAALCGIEDEGEQTRLRLLYARKRGMLVDGTGWINPAAVRLQELPDPDHLIRPFGIIGSVYRVNDLGLVCHWLAYGVTLVAVGAFAWTRTSSPSLSPAIFVAGLALIAVLQALAVLNGKKLAPQPTT